MASKQLVSLAGQESYHSAPVRRKESRRRKERSPQPLIRSAATGYVAAKSASFVAKQAFEEDGRLTVRAENWLTTAVTVQRPVVLANLRRLRKAHPTLSNRQLAAQLDKEFKRAMTGGGAVIGATAAVPAVGTATSLGISVVSTGGFLEFSAIYAQSMAELSGLSTDDPERSKLLVMAIMLGEEGRKLLGELSAQVQGRGEGPIGTLVPLSSLASHSMGTSTVAGLVSQQIKKQFLRRFFIRQGTSMVARAIPYGIGAVVGGIGNRALASQIVRTSHRTFGELPEETPSALVEDFTKGLEREKLRAERQERRSKKKTITDEARAQRREQKRRRALERGPSPVVRGLNRLRG